jgi:hypothetical protein
LFGTEFNAFNDKSVFARDGELTNIHNDSEKIAGGEEELKSKQGNDRIG